MKLEEAERLNKLIANAKKEIDTTNRGIDRSIRRLSRHSDEGMLLSTTLKKDREELIKFAKTHSEDEIKVMGEKILKKWQ